MSPFTQAVAAVIRHKLGELEGAARGQAEAAAAARQTAAASARDAEQRLSKQLEQAQAQVRLTVRCCVHMNRQHLPPLPCPEPDKCCVGTTAGC
jgi:hypothetical protein